MNVRSYKCENKKKRYFPLRFVFFLIKLGLISYNSIFPTVHNKFSHPDLTVVQVNQFPKYSPQGRFFPLIDINGSFGICNYSPSYGTHVYRDTNKLSLVVVSEVQRDSEEKTRIDIDTQIEREIKRERYTRKKYCSQNTKVKLSFVIKSIEQFLNEFTAVIILCMFTDYKLQNFPEN